MKLFVIAALIAVAAAGRLEHLERSYLPPDNSIAATRSFGSTSGFGSNHGGFGSNQGGFGSNHGGFGSNQGSFGAGSRGSLGSHSSFGAAGTGFARSGAGAFPGATSNQYLPPNHGSASGASPFGRSSLGGFGSQNLNSQYQGGHQASANQFGSPSFQYGAPQASSFRSQGQFPQHSAATSRQYLAPRTTSFQNTPQQPFDEQTGYHY